MERQLSGISQISKNDINRQCHAGEKTHIQIIAGDMEKLRKKP
jgi:hypothetical protein